MKGKLLGLSVLAFFALAPLIGMPPAAGEWSWYRTIQVERVPILDVPYVPTPYEIVSKMLNVAEVKSSDILYDLGCGDGRIVVTAAKERKVRRAVGIDIDPRRIEESNKNARQARVSSRVSFLQKDLFEVDLSEATVVSLYLLPSINLKLRPKLLKELKPGSRIVSHDFDMGDLQPDQTAKVNEHTVYFWVVPASVNGTWKWEHLNGREQEAYELRLGQNFQNVEFAELKAGDTAQAVRNIGLRGTRLEFTVDGDLNGLKGPVRFSGLVKGDTIKGTLSSNGSGARMTRKVQALRDASTAAPADAMAAARIQL